MTDVEQAGCITLERELGVDDFVVDLLGSDLDSAVERGLVDCGKLPDQLTELDREFREFSEYGEIFGASGFVEIEEKTWGETTVVEIAIIDVLLVFSGGRTFKILLGPCLPAVIVEFIPRLNQVTLHQSGNFPKGSVRAGMGWGFRTCRKGSLRARARVGSSKTGTCLNDKVGGRYWLVHLTV